MNKTIAAAVAISLLGAATLAAQPATLKVKAGHKFSYNTTSEMALTQSMGGQEMTMNSTTEGTLELKAGKVAKERIEWSFGAPSLRLTMHNEMMPGGKMDTTITTPPQTYITDGSGKVIEAPTTAESNQMQMMMGGSMMKNFAQWFAPSQTRSSKKGESWEEARRDTMKMGEGENGLSIVSNQTMRYTVEGTTDTLGTRAVRVRWVATTMTFEGGGSAQGMSMTLDGDGSASGISYYSTKDGILLASSTTSESNMRLAITGQGQDMIIPMVQSVTSTVIRK